MGFTFNEPTKQITVNVAGFLEKFQALLDRFSKAEDRAKHIINSFKEGPEVGTAVMTALREHGKNLLKSKQTSPGGSVSWTKEEMSDSGAISYEMWSSGFWQGKDWYWDLRGIVPYLILEAAKHGPKDISKLQKMHKFWEKPFKWSPPSSNRDSELCKKYLAVLEDLRKQLTLLQSVFAHAGTQDSSSVEIGKFQLFDSFGDPEKIKVATEVLQKATKAMAGIGLGAHCYGKVTLVDASKFASKSAAFYVKKISSVCWSPDLRGEDVRALCHELSHRVHTKLSLSHRSRELWDTVKERNCWVTNYARTSPEENFCEMVSFAAVKKLTDEGKDLLKAALSTLKLATSQSVVARWAARL